MLDVDTVATWKHRRKFAKKLLRRQPSWQRLREGESGWGDSGCVHQWHGRGVRRGLRYLVAEAEDMLHRLEYDTDEDTDPAVETYSSEDYDTPYDQVGEDKGWQQRVIECKARLVRLENNAERERLASNAETSPDNNFINGMDDGDRDDKGGECDDKSGEYEGKGDRDAKGGDCDDDRDDKSGDQAAADTVV
jgi:hypothetical protein